MSGFFSFILSAVTTYIARNVFGYIEDGPVIVTLRNYIGYRKYLDKADFDKFDNGFFMELETIVPIYHRRLIGYSVDELR